MVYILLSIYSIFFLYHFFFHSVSSWGLQPRLVPVCAGAGCTRRFRKVPGGSARFGVCWCRFRRQVPESSAKTHGRLWKVPACAGAGSGGRFRRRVGLEGFRNSVGGGAGAKVGGSGRFRKVPESQRPGAGSGGFCKPINKTGAGSLRA